MAGELQADYQQSGLVNLIYFEVRSATSTIYNFSSLAFEAYNASNIANYGRFATEQGASGFYVANMPAVALGNYTIRAKLAQVASTPAENDTRIGFQQMFWSGTAVLTPGAVTTPVTVGDYSTGKDPATLVWTSTTNYGVSTIGAQLQHNLDATISSRLVGSAVPPNFTALGIDGSGNLTGSIASVAGSVGSVAGAVASVTAPVTVGTNNDKTGYALTQAFPANFSALSIDTSGRMAIQTNETINTALASFEFLMVRASNGDPFPGLTVLSQRSIDGGPFLGCSHQATELSNGIYKIDLEASDRNGKVITFMFSASQAATRYITIVTTP